MERAEKLLPDLRVSEDACKYLVLALTDLVTDNKAGAVIA